MRERGHLRATRPSATRRPTSPLAQALRDALTPSTSPSASDGPPAAHAAHLQRHANAQVQPLADTPPDATESFATLLAAQERQGFPQVWHDKQALERLGREPPPRTRSPSASHPPADAAPSSTARYAQPDRPAADPARIDTARRTAQGLQALRGLQRALDEQTRRERAERQRAERASEATQAAGRTFRAAVGAVQPLSPDGRVLHEVRRDPLPIQRWLDEQAVLRESLSDEFDAGSLLDTDERLSFLRPGVAPDVARRLRRGEWAIQAQLDLHGLRTDAARDALGQFIRESHRAGLRCVRVIHGKGLGSPGKTPVLKSRVQRWLVQKAEIMAFVQANPNQGGDGAVVVLLRAHRR